MIKFENTAAFVWSNTTSISILIYETVQKIKIKTNSLDGRAEQSFVWTGLDKCVS